MWHGKSDQEPQLGSGHDNGGHSSQKCVGALSLRVPA